MWMTSLIDGPISAPIYDPEETDAEGNVTRAVIGWQDGYRLNVAPTVMCDELEPYRVTPNEKLRGFFGAQTYRLLFPDEATARGLMAEYWVESE